VIFLSLLAVFLFPLLARASLYPFAGGPRGWRDADWSSTHTLPLATKFPQPRVLVLSGRTGGWKGVVAVHSWIVVKRTNAPGWTRYDVAGWGSPLKVNNWPPDGRWYGTAPTVIADVTGSAAEALIPRIEAAVRSYPYTQAGDYRVWPGPNSNTFVAFVLRAVPEIGVEMPPNAIGRDFRPRPYAGVTDSRTGLEASLWGLLGVKIGWVEGVEVNVLGLVVGLDLRYPALKLPGFGRVGIDGPTLLAAAQ
jgi:hypothetical protein